MAIGNLIISISTTGQVILPNAILERLHWEAGTRLIVENTPDGLLLRPMVPAFVPTHSENAFGCLPVQGKSRSVGEMDVGIVAHAISTRRIGCLADGQV